MLTDTHCHLDFDTFDPDRRAVLDRAHNVGVERILVPALTLESSRSIIQFIQTDRCLYAAAGIHPTETAAWQAGIAGELIRIVMDNPRLVAIGEIGLDYYWESAPHEKQKYALQAQLELAAEACLPVIIHFREKGDVSDGPCAKDLLGILSSWISQLPNNHSLNGRAGVLHSFAGSLATAQWAIELGFFLGISGPVTYRKERQELVAELPLERMLLETDAPFQSPAPWRGRRNEPAFTALIADKIAACHKCTTVKVTETTKMNANRLFAWE